MKMISIMQYNKKYLRGKNEITNGMIYTQVSLV